MSPGRISTFVRARRWRIRQGYVDLRQCGRECGSRMDDPSGSDGRQNF